MTKYMYAVAIVSQSKTGLNARLTNGWNVDAKEFEKSFNDFIEGYEKGYENCVKLVSCNFYPISTEGEAFEINLNENGLKTTKLIDFKNEIISILKGKND